MPLSSVETIKCVVVGDGGVGKTSLILSYILPFPEETHPSRLDDDRNDLVIDSNPVSLSLVDTAGQDEYDGTRHLSYLNTDVFLICYSVDSRISMANVAQKWWPEVRHHCPGVPTILVGNKIDLREDESTIVKLKEIGQTPSTYKDGLAVTNKIGAIRYVECSVLKTVGDKRAFDEAIQSAFLSWKRHRLCQIL